jgi:hypothetical protein
MTSLQTPAPGRRRRINTSARIQSAVRAAQSAGLTIKRLTVGPDGAITIETGEPAASTLSKTTPLGSWEGVEHGKDRTQIRKSVS